MHRKILTIVVVMLSLSLLLIDAPAALADFDFFTFHLLGPSLLEQTQPGSVAYVEETDFNVMAHSEPGDVTAQVGVIDIDPTLGNTSTSGCEPADFIGFTPGNIALIQRGYCFFQEKAQNAASAGAVGVIIFNQGNTEDRMGLVNGTLGLDYNGGIPVFFTTFARGVEWAGTSGLELHMIANVFRGQMTLDEFSDFIDNSVDDGTLVGSGPGSSADGRLTALRDKIDEAIALIEADDISGACHKLQNVLNRVDGLPRPPDFATGDAADELRTLILEIRYSLGCGL